MKKKENLQMIGEGGISTRHNSSVSIKEATAGITLIALVITIIVLLLLAGVAISMLSGENGILNKASDAKVTNKEGLIKEEIILAYNAVQTEGYIEKWDLIKKAEEMEKELQKQDEETRVTVQATNLKIKYKGYETTISDNGILGELVIGKIPIKINYYSNILQTIEVVNNSTMDDDTLTTTKEQAKVAIYFYENEELNLVLLENSILDTQIELSSDIILDLNGKTLTFNNENAIKVTSGDITIDGIAGGSKIIVDNNTQETMIAQVSNGSLTLNGGTYESKSNGVGTDEDPNASILVGGTGTLTVANADIIANDTDGGTITGILVEQGGTAVVSNSNIELTSLDGLKSDGIRNYGTATVSNTSVAAYSNYTANAAKTDYATTTRGINNEGTMTLKNCEVYGTHSGIRSTGTLYIDGGTYEGYGHGGIYFAGAETTSYVKNAYIGICEMKNGYDDGIAGTNKAGFYIGGASDVTVYMDNCELWGTYYPLVMRNSGGEDNNSLYISNSTLKEGFERYIRIETSRNNKIYIGKGNNFTSEGDESVVSWDSNGVVTDVDYSTQFPEY